MAIRLLRTDTTPRVRAELRLATGSIASTQRPCSSGVHISLFYERMGPQIGANQQLSQEQEHLAQSGIVILSSFAQCLQSYLHGIIARCRYPLNTNFLEGINTGIEVTNRRSYGYRD